jgi:dihydroorotase
MVLVDMNEERVISPQTTFSPLKTPANGMSVKGWPKMTIKGGQVVFRDGQLTVKPGCGRVLRSY